MKIPLLSLIACISHLGPITLGIFRWHRLNRSMKMFLIFCIFLFAEYVIQITYSLLRWNNLEISHYGILMENLLLAGVYIVSGRGKKLQTACFALLSIYLLGWGLIMACVHVPYRIDSWALTLGMFTVICFGIAYMFEELTQNTTDLKGDPLFWVASGSLLYNIGALLVIGLANELASLGYAQFHEIWQLNLLLIIASNLIYMRSFRCLMP